jgi:hypothetical protein
MVAFLYAKSNIRLYFESVVTKGDRPPLVMMPCCSASSRVSRTISLFAS